jgi:hypothetical protein
MKIILAISTALLLATNSIANAGTKRLIYSGAYDQAVQEVYFVNKKLISTNKDKESLYRVNLEVKIQIFINNRRIVNKVSELFNCSKNNPYIASKHYLDSSNSEGLIFYINPQGEPEDTRMIGDRLAWKYWAVCHNIPNVTKVDLVNLSSKYGYKNNLKTENEKLPHNLKKYFR